MDTNKFLIATIAGAVTIFATGFIIFGLILPAIGLPPPESDCFNEDGVLWIQIMNNLIFAGGLAYIFAKWAGISTFNTGLKAGAAIGFFLGLAIAGMFYGSTDIFSSQIFAIGSIGVAIEMGLAGGVIGYLLGRGSE